MTGIDAQPDGDVLDPDEGSESSVAAQYRLLAEHATDVVLLLGTEGKYVWASPSVEETLGWSREEMLGRSIVDFVHPDDYAAVMESRRQERGGVAELDAMRFRRKDGTYVWVSAKARTVHEGVGGQVERVVTLRDVHDQVAAQRALEWSERRFRLLAENASDVVYETDTDGVVLWVSPSVERLLGWHVHEFVGRRAMEFVIAEDFDHAWASRTKVYEGLSVRGVEARFRCADGEARWMSVQARPIHAPDGTIVASVVGVRDCQAEVTTRRALNTRSVATGVLLTATDENDLLWAMCQAAVDGGGYLFTLYGRPLQDDFHTVKPVAHSRQNADYLDDVVISWDAANELGRGPTGRAVRERKPMIVHDFREEASFRPWLDAAVERGFRSSLSSPVIVDGEVDGVFMVYAAEPNAFDDAAVELMTDMAAQVGFGLQRLRDEARLREAMNYQALLIAAVEQATESVVITDPSAAILYANPAAQRVSGWSLEELRGQNPRLFKSGLQDPEYYEQMWNRLTSGRPWHGTLVNRRRNGELYEEDVSIAPIFDPAGELLAYVGVKRDLSAERQLEADLSRHHDDRETMLAVMSRVRPMGTLAATSTEFCMAVCELSGFDAAGVWIAESMEVFRPVGCAGAMPEPLRSEAVRLENVGGIFAELGNKARSIGLAEQGARARLGAEVSDLLLNNGFTALGIALVPIGDGTLGLLVAGSKGADGPATMQNRRTVLEELGSFAATLLASEFGQDGVEASLHAEIDTIIQSVQFHPVFQPVVDLTTRQVFGYEALTRFDDGVAPDVHFALAHSIGRGGELEVVCATAAIEAAHSLPSDVWLSINVSPSTVISGQAATLAGNDTRDLVVEVTEHSRIENYPDLRRSLRRLAPLRVSVDDAGAGFASLRHILELKPDFVKLDIALVRGIDTDPARQALTVGLCHFVARTGAVLIAEGIETQAEADTLRRLGVPFGQGYLYGRPEPLA